MRAAIAGFSVASLALVFAACGGEVDADVALGGAGNDAGSDASPDASGNDHGGSSVDASGPARVDAGTPITPGYFDAGPDGGPPVYGLTVQSSGAAPLANGCGITFDGTELWMLSSGGTPQPYTLARFDASTFAIDRSFVLASLFATLGTNAGGIAWDGSSIWISVAGHSNSLVQIDPTTGAILKTISSPTMLGPSDLDFDGIDLWLSTGTGDAFQMTTPNGATLKHFSLPLGDQRDDGIAFRAGELFIGQLFGGIEVYDPSNGNMIGSVVHQDGTAFDQTEIGPSVFAGADEFVMLSSLGITKYQAIKLVP